MLAQLPQEVNDCVTQVSGDCLVLHNGCKSMNVSSLGWYEKF